MNHMVSQLKHRNRLTITADVLIVEPIGWDRIWNFRRRLEVPLASISAVTVEARPMLLPMGWRGPGLSAGAKYSGTFHPSGAKHFWNTSGPAPALRVFLDPRQHFHELVLSVSDPATAAKEIQEAVAKAQLRS